VSSTRRNWRRYDYAKTRRKQLFVTILLLVLDATPLPTTYKGRGRPPIPLRTVIICLAYKIYYRSSYRDTIAEVKHDKARLGIEVVPCYNTLRRYMNSQTVTKTLSLLLIASVRPVHLLETVFGSDSTGFRTDNRSDYYTIRVRTSGRRIVEDPDKDKDKNGKREGPSLLERRWRRDFVKLHLAVGMASQMICAATATVGWRHDATQLPGLISQVRQIFSIKEWVGDSAYTSRKACTLLGSLGAKPLLWPRKGFTKKSLGSPQWRRMLEYFELDPENFSKHYHQRSKAETVMSVVKNYFGDYVLSKKLGAQLNELLFKALDYNICRLGYLTAIGVLELPKTENLQEPQELGEPPPQSPQPPQPPQPV